MASADALAGAAAVKKKREDAARIAAQNQFLAGTPNRTTPYRVSPDTMEAGAAVKAGVPTIGSSGAPTLKQQLDKVDWVGLGKLMGRGSQGGGGQSSSTPPPAEEVPKTTMPVDGTPAPAPVSNVQQTSDMFAQALAELQRQYGTSQENINAAIARMEADPYNRANAYAQMQLAPARVAADPLAQYMAAAGLSDQQSAANAQLAQSEADAYQQAMQNVQNVLQQSQEQANLSRLADIGLIRTGAQQDLESNLNMLRLGLDKERIGALTGLQQRNLENQLNQRNAIANQISSIFSGQDVAPESILKLIEAALAKTNMNRWTDLPMMGA